MSSYEGRSLDGDAETATRLLGNIETVVRGKTEEIRLVLSALLCGGHVLLEDVPGTAKTGLARAIGGSIEGATNARVQITRAMPKAQSARLEAMAEQQVTTDGVTRQLPDPSLVLATENPIEQEGTF